jgi:hypothetical protein
VLSINMEHKCFWKAWRKHDQHLWLEWCVNALGILPSSVSSSFSWYWRRHKPGFLFQNNKVSRHHLQTIYFRPQSNGPSYVKCVRILCVVCRSVKKKCIGMSCTLPAYFISEITIWKSTKFGFGVRTSSSKAIGLL